jgi:adhesin transport system outer membrane protein
MQKHIRLLLGAMVLPVCAFAQVQTLKESAQQVISTNPEVLQRWHAFEAAEGERDVAFGALLPRVDLSAGVGRDRYDNPTTRADVRRNGTTVTLTQLLYDGFGTYQDMRRLDYARRVRLFELYDAIEGAVLETARAYFDVLRFRALVVLAEENYVRHRSVFEQIQRKTAAGVGRRVDLEQAAGRLALAESNLLTETANLHDVSARFQRLVGKSPRKDLEMPKALSKDIPASMAVALQTATSRHPALQAAIENVRSAERGAKSRYGAFQPRVDMRLRNERGTNLGGIGGDTKNNIAEVVLSWNLFNGGSDMARVRQFAEQLNIARDQRDKTCRDLRQTLAIAYNDVRKLKEQLTYLDQHQLSIEKARDAYRKQFDIGQRSLLDVLDTENELFQAKRAYTNAEFDLETAFARTHAGIGSLFSALDLTRPDVGNVPNSPPGNGEEAQGCPAEGPEVYTVNKDALNARAQEMVRESVQAAADAAAALAPPGTAPSATTPPTPTPGKPAPVPAPAVPPATLVAPVPQQPAAVLPAPAVKAEPTEPAADSSQKAVVDALKAWSTAWAKRDEQGYLDAYSPNFKPAGGATREAWVTQRKTIIGAAKQIDLNISKVQVELKDPKHVVATFVQSYRSPSYRDVVQKTLEWENVDGRWLITSETVAPLKR